MEAQNSFGRTKMPPYDNYNLWAAIKRGCNNHAMPVQNKISGAFRARRDAGRH
jgi:hypothetical protein